MSHSSSPKKNRRPVARAMWLLNRLLKDGGTLSVAEAAEVMDVNVSAARDLVQTILNEFEHATSGVLAKMSIRVVGVRSGEPDHEVAIAASLGAATADLFAGTSLQTGMKKALAYVVSASANADKFKDLERKFFFVRRSGERGLPGRAELLETMAKAVLDQKPLRIAYRGFAGERVRKETIEPLSIALHDRRVYVIAKRQGDASLRAYRFSRFLHVTRVGNRFPYPKPHEFDPRVLFRDSFGIFLPGKNHHPTEVRIRLSDKWKQYATGQLWHESQEVRPVEDGVEVTFRLRVCPEFEMWIQSFGPDAEVLEPSWLREQMTQRAQKLAAVYAK